MAYWDPDALLTAIREVLEDGTGSLRKITAGTYLGDLPEGLSADEESSRAMDAPRVEASIGSVERHPAGPPIFGNVALYRVEVSVRVVRHLNPDHKLSDSLRDDVKALAAKDADVVGQALTYPGNLTQTSGATATGLVSGCLFYEGSDPAEVSQSDTGHRIETTHRFRGIVQVAPATS